MKTLFKKSEHGGFTLIELLVVIAIIGILAGIVLVSLSGARDRAKDGRIISDMGQIRTSATIWEGNHSVYTGFETSTDENTLADDIGGTTGQNPGGYVFYTDDDGGGYCATALLNSGEVWCIDSDMKSEQDANQTTTACQSTCEATNTCLCD